MSENNKAQENYAQENALFKTMHTIDGGVNLDRLHNVASAFSPTYSIYPTGPECEVKNAKLFKIKGFVIRSKTVTYNDFIIEFPEGAIVEIITE